MSDSSLDRYRPWLYGAALYNLVWGAVTILFPTAYFRLVRMRRPTDLTPWQLVGMFVLVYAPAYWWAARRPTQHVHLVLIGFMGKIMGPIGLVWGTVTGRVPARLGLIILSNDIVWWPSFFLYLRDAARLRGGWRRMLGGE